MARARNTHCGDKKCKQASAGKPQERHNLGNLNVFKMKTCFACFLLVSYLAYSLILKTEVIISSKMSVGFQQTLNIISQKIELFIVTTVKTSDLTYTAGLSNL
jgi:hypothetical protein